MCLINICKIFVSGPVYEVIKKCDKIKKKVHNFLIFPTIHDAVLFAFVNDINKKDFWVYIYLFVFI